MKPFDKWSKEWCQGLLHDGDDSSKVAYLAAKAARDAAQPQWQPIETAPIGIWCLFLDGRGTMEAARYGHAVHVDKVLQKADNEPIHETFYNYYHNYTHWMPLPEAPQEDE